MEMRLEQQISELDPGSHLCLLYDRDDAQQRLALTSFIAAGLGRHERCIYVADDRTVDEIARVLQAGGIAVQAQSALRALQLWTRREWRLDRELDVEKKGAHVRRIIEGAQALGFEGIRFAIEMGWALNPDIADEELIHWEAALNQVLVTAFPTRMICQYRRERHSPIVLKGALRTHPQVILGQGIYSSLFYESPLLSNSRPERERLNLTIDQQELEERVNRRTADLRIANQKLEKEIAERRQANEQLRLLSAHLQSAREEERVRIARELHDDLGQMLTAVRIDVSLIGEQLRAQGAPAAGLPEVDQISPTLGLIDELIQRMHGIIRELRPAVLDLLGLEEALGWQVQEFRERTGIECRFRSNLGERVLDPDRSTALFRILQESLTNVARHAEATHVNVVLKQVDGCVLLRVRDNGKGISEVDRADSRTVGILGMRERAVAFGGEVKLESKPAEGTVVTARIPAGGTDG